MVKLKPLIVVVTLLLSVSLVSTCAARTPRTVVDFSISGSGSCLVLDAAYDYMEDFSVNVGTGTVNVAGTSLVKSFAVPLISGPSAVYGSFGQSRLFQRSLAVSWEGHSVTVTFLPKDIISALFFDEYWLDFEESGDYVLIDDFGFSGPGQMLPYRAAYTDATGTHSFSGAAIIYVEPIEDNGNSGTAILVVLFSYSGGIMEFAWFSMEYDGEFDDTPITVPASTVQCSVTVGTA